MTAIEAAVGLIGRDGGETRALFLKIESKILRRQVGLIPLPLRLPVHGTDTMSVLQEPADKMSADKTTGAGYENRFTHEL